MSSIDFKKLIGSKWTAARPEEKQKHFVVTGVGGSARTEGSERFVELQALHSRQIRRVSPDALRDDSKWKRGWA